MFTRNTLEPSAWTCANTNSSITRACDTFWTFIAQTMTHFLSDPNENVMPSLMSGYFYMISIYRGTEMVCDRSENLLNGGSTGPG